MVDYSGSRIIYAVFGAKDEIRLAQLWIYELSWKARGRESTNKWIHTQQIHKRIQKVYYLEVFPNPND